MSILLVQGCSKSKNRPGEPVPALELYSGFFFKIIKKAMREGDFDDRLDTCILSAKHGLIDSQTNIQRYDLRMDRDRAAEIAPTVQAELRERADGEYDNIVINVGSAYRRAFEGFEASVDQNVHYIEGEGIGHKGHTLKRLVRGDFEAVTGESLCRVGSD